MSRLRLITGNKGSYYPHVTIGQDPGGSSNEHVQMVAVLYESEKPVIYRYGICVFRRICTAHITLMNSKVCLGAATAGYKHDAEKYYEELRCDHA